MNKYVVVGMDTDEQFIMLARTPYEAMQKMLYTLNLNRLDSSATVQKTESGLHLYVVHNGNTYAVRN